MSYGDSSQVVCFENHAEWRFCLAPFFCVALGRRSGARARCCFLLLFSPCVVHVRTSVDVHLDSCDRTQAFHSKQSYPLHHLQHKNNDMLTVTFR